VSALLSGDLAMFRQLGIAAELLAAAGIRRVTDTEAREQFGIRRSNERAQ